MPYFIRYRSLLIWLHIINVTLQQGRAIADASDWCNMNRTISVHHNKEWFNIQEATGQPGRQMQCRWQFEAAAGQQLDFVVTNTTYQIEIYSGNGTRDEIPGHISGEKVFVSVDGLIEIKFSSRDKSNNVLTGYFQSIPGPEMVLNATATHVSQEIDFTTLYASPNQSRRFNFSSNLFQEIRLHASEGREVELQLTVVGCCDVIQIFSSGVSLGTGSGRYVSSDRLLIIRIRYGSRSKISSMKGRYVSINKTVASSLTITTCLFRLNVTDRPKPFSTVKDPNGGMCEWRFKAPDGKGVKLAIVAAPLDNYPVNGEIRIFSKGIQIGSVVGPLSRFRFHPLLYRSFTRGMTVTYNSQGGGRYAGWYMTDTGHSSAFGFAAILLVLLVFGFASVSAAYWVVMVLLHNIRAVSRQHVRLM